eukprot:CAMPEP_0174286156 /NCGR_PEP_ID=MMETSP0809-20121228/10652_1 /TAXON_ID=73025 ORGANISM="Eutreptiella gymnastica-like, Strain CCMP1594" /NCGR_SAMPLE_ID=MMETSP0809 /ASSEMBLY_ACC=CAM_ASM_000658 /LENGTH=1542 /DNA_ID=CAMNT_0015382103 /DNA_START=109 /DNA_END=4737 /DNA_ORIENTATION=-
MKCFSIFVAILIFSVVSVQGDFFNEDLPQRHTDGVKFPQVVPRHRRHQFGVQQVTVAGVPASCNHNLTQSDICFASRDEVFASGQNLQMLVLRMELPDVRFTQEERNFDYKNWYITTTDTGGNGVLGHYVSQNSKGLFSITLVDEEVTLYTSAFNQSELLAAVQAHVAQYPTADPEQLFFNAIGNEVIRQYFHVSGQSVAVYDIWAIHIPKAASYSMAVVGKGLAVSGGGGGAWRDATQAWGVLFNMKSGGLLRLPVGGSSWAAIVKGDSISGIGNACVGEVDLDAHWPVHEKRRAGWYRPGKEMKDLSSSGVYRLYSHNTFFNTSLYTVPEDGWLGLKVGPYTHTWYVSYYDMPEMEVGATLYLTTPDYTFGSILIDATPESDACPNCPTGYGCPCCTAANTTAVTLGSMYDAGYFTISTIATGTDSLGNKYIDVNISMSLTQLCPLPDHFGSDCEKPCWGGVDKCGGSSQGSCSSGPTGSGQCNCVGGWYGGWYGLGCNEDDFCDADSIARKNPQLAMSSFKTPTKSVELVSDFFNAGRTGNIGKITVTGKFLGTHAYTPSVVELALYNVDSTTNGSMPFQTIVRANVTQGETGNITITYPTFFDSFDLEVALAPHHPLAQVNLQPGRYWLSVMPLLNSGESWIVDSIAADLEAGFPDLQSFDGAGWTFTQSTYTAVTNPTSGRMLVDITASTCKEYFKPFPDMKVLIIRMQYPDLAMQDPDMYWDYNGTFGFNGTFAAQIAQSSQGKCTLQSHLVDDWRLYFVTPVFMSMNNISSLIDMTRLNDASYRFALFEALKADALITVRNAGFDPDLYDVHFGFYPAFGNNQMLQRPWPSTKGVWAVGPSTTAINSMFTAFGFVLGLQTSWFLRPMLDTYQQDVIRIPEGASIDAMGWPWLVPSFMNTSTLVDYNVNDKAKLGWIEGGMGLLALNRTSGKVSFNLYAHNAATPGVYKGVYISEPGVMHGYWLQYYDAPSRVINKGLSIIFEDESSRSIFLDATNTTDNCPGCMTGVELACKSCDMRDTTVVPGVHYLVGYFSVDVGTPGADAAGPYLPVTVTFSDTELCLLNGHYGAGCQFQCPGGAMDVCNGKAACSTGVSGAGTCACSNMGMSCAFDDACDKSYGNSPLHTVGSQEKLLYSFSDQAPYHKSLGPAADFEVSRPAHIKGITIWGRAGMTWTSTDIYRPRLPSVVKVIFYYNDASTNQPGQVRDIKYVNRPEFITMQAGPQLLSTVTKIDVRFDPNEDVNRYTLWPGKYWVQVLVEDDVLWEVVMTTAGTQGNYPDLFMDEYNTLGLGFNTSWHTTVATAAHIPSLMGATSLEMKFQLNFDHCLPSYQYEGIPLPRPEVTTYEYLDFFPKKAIEGETLNITFRGYIPYGCGQTAMVKIANTRQGYGCYGEAPGGEARPLHPNKQVTFTVSVPGVYSVCIKTQYDLDWEEIGREDLVVYEFQSMENFYGFSSCMALMNYNTSVCGCMYDQPGTGQVSMVLPQDFPYAYMTVGTTPILVRQGCCTYITDKVEEYSFVDATLTPTGNKWKLCLNNPE